MSEELPFLPYGRQTIEDDDIAAVAEAMRSPFLTTGPQVSAFEAELAEATGFRHATAVNSGSAALHAAYAALGVGPGTVVVTSPITFASTANVAIHLGAEVAFADVDKDSALLDPASVAASLDGRPALVVPIDYAGQIADYAAFAAMREDEGPVFGVVGDSAHALGANLAGVAELADALATSLHPVKSITTGEGGVVLTHASELAARCARFRHHGMERDREKLRRVEGPWWHEMHELGLNYRITDFACALGRSQLRKLGRFVRRRQALAHAYFERLRDLDSLQLPKVPDIDASAWHLFVVRVKDASRRRPFFEALRASGLGVQVHYIPVYWHPYYADRGFRRGLCPRAEDFYARAVSIPIYPTMTDADLESSAERIRKVAQAVL